MPRRVQSGTPADLEALVERFAEHRRSRSQVRRLPESLWRQAARLASRYGVNRVHLALGLNYHDLKRRMEALAAVKPATAKPAESRRRPTFVEVGLGAPLLSGGTLVEVEERGGRKLTVQLAIEQGAELIPLVRTVWGGAS